MTLQQKYLVGATCGGGLVMQISRGPHRSKLISIEDSYIEAFECREVPVPDSPIEDDAAADAYLESLVQQGAISIHDLNLQQLVEVRASVLS